MHGHDALTTLKDTSYMRTRQVVAAFTSHDVHDGKNPISICKVSPLHLQL